MKFWILTEGSSEDGMSGYGNYPKRIAITMNEELAQQWEKRCRDDPYCIGKAIEEDTDSLPNVTTMEEVERILTPVEKPVPLKRYTIKRSGICTLCRQFMMKGDLCRNDNCPEKDHED